MPLSLTSKLRSYFSRNSSFVYKSQPVPAEYPNETLTNTVQTKQQSHHPASSTSLQLHVPDIADVSERSQPPCYVLLLTSYPDC
jgi:hypothetical protein